MSFATATTVEIVWIELDVPCATTSLACPTQTDRLFDTTTPKILIDATVITASTVVQAIVYIIQLPKNWKR